MGASRMIFKKILMVAERPRIAIKKMLTNRQSVFGSLSKQAWGNWIGVGEAPETIILDSVLSDQIKMSTARE